jgi:transcriptional regulator with XRE-family HTH domain
MTGGVPDTGTIGGRLRSARLAAGMSQTDVEHLSGIPKARLSRYDNNHVEPSIGSLLKLCVALEVPPSGIIDQAYRAAMGAGD